MVVPANDSRYEFTSPATSASTPGTYAAAQPSRLRRRPRTSLKHEDDHLPQRDRDRVQTATMDEHRNFAIAGWMVRKHLDFVAEHNFNCTHESRTFEQEIEGRVKSWSEPRNFDIRERHCLADHIRIDEAMRTIGGDILLQKTSTGHLQAIEADRIRDPKPKKSDRWRNGILQNRAGKATWFAVHRRTKHGKFQFERLLPAEEVYHFGYFNRHDQARGITSISSALDYLHSTNETIKYAVAKAKLSQMLGIVLTKDDPNYGEVDLTTGGPFVTEIGTDEKFEFFNDKTPSTQLDNFLRHLISIVMKCLDLPYNFYDESHTNFFGSRAAVIIYLQSCRWKRRQVQALLNHLTRWRMNFEIAERGLVLPRGMTVERIPFEWIPIGMPWWNPTQEATAAQKMIDLRLRTRTEIRRETHGDNWADVVPGQLAREEKILRDAGLEA